MIVRCEKCETVYDDASRWTLCPHGPLGGGNRYCRTHDLDPCPFCDPAATNPIVAETAEQRRVNQRRHDLLLDRIARENPPTMDFGSDLLAGTKEPG